MGNTAQQCRLGLFQDSDFVGDLEDSKSTSRGILCIFGSHTFVPTSWMCEKQTSVSHSSTESRMDGNLALDLWDLVIEVLHFSPNQSKKSSENVQHDTPSRKQTKDKVQTPNQYNDLDFCNVHYVSSNVKLKREVFSIQCDALFTFLKTRKQ